jgi:ATP-dependent RNA helicase SUPV3L1/SUV3
MLSITGMTLEQFANLMGGLGYKAEKSERPKVKATETAPAAPAVDEIIAAAAAAGQPIPEEVSLLAPAPEAPPEEDGAEGDATDEATPAVEMESFYTFTWAPQVPGTRIQARAANAAPAPRASRAAKPRRRPTAATGRRAAGARVKKPEGDKPQGDRPQAEGASPATSRRGDRPKGDRDDRKDYGGKSIAGTTARTARSPPEFEARPPRPEKPIDPDNPFAACWR